MTNHKYIVMIKTTVFLVALSVFFSCSDIDRRAALLPNTTGKPGEIVVIINQDREAGLLGQALFSHFGQSQVGLPQDEPLFDLITVPPAAFRSVFERHRNVINIIIGGDTARQGLYVSENAWADPQVYVSLHTDTEAEMLSLIDSVQSNLIKLFLAKDRERNQIQYSQYSNKTISDRLVSHFGFSLTVPKGYNIDAIDSSFLWMTYEARDLSQGIIIYTQPYTDTAQFSKKGIISYRDTLFSHKVPGPTDKSYMQTELRIYEPEIWTHTLMDKAFTVEMRGIWRVENDFMGGPFLSYSVLDQANNRIITLYGYVYAPRFEKRSYIRQIEAILRSFKLAEAKQ